MTKKNVFSILMVLFVSTVTFSHLPIPTIYDLNSVTLPQTHPPTIRNIVVDGNKAIVDFVDYGNGLTRPIGVQYYYFDVYLDGAFYVQTDKSPLTLSGLTAGEHTVMIVLMCRSNDFIEFSEWPEVGLGTFNILPLSTPTCICCNSSPCCCK
jgi:hypothetical protein